MTASRSIAAASPLDRRFAEVVAGDLFALSNAIASAVGGAVAIEDTGGQVLAYSNLPRQEILHTLADRPELVEELRLKPVTALVEHDALHGTAYAQTLLAYFGALGDSLRVASELVIHENTVRYRVRRAREMFGVDLSDPDNLLATWLQLRLLQLRSDAP
ncbi:helix-turn-helix domain-containing protein [Nonomuraea insulae]|uniref:Helix-turn-helix domain-containing protein n=1 Tax=Nonomuraea insulae TaxID=1616787 RepID=A0ABW1CJJ4_9ACTN